MKNKQENLYDICVVGGGASGMAAAIAARREGASVLVLEQMQSLGKKILATGNGKCNLTNANILKQSIPDDAYRCGRRDFPVHVLKNFDANDTLKFFSSVSVYTRNRDGYVYPMSEQAATIRDALFEELNELGVVCVTQTSVQSVLKFSKKRNDIIDSDIFLIRTKDQEYQCKKLILACGGKSGQNLGSDGSGFKLCENLGHRICPIVPALCGLRCKEKIFKELAGVRIQAKVTLYANDRVIATDCGELQLTDYGISGIPVFQVSRYAAYALKNRQNVSAILDLMPEMNEKNICKCLQKQVLYHKERPMVLVLTGLVNRKVAACLLKLSHISLDTTAKDVKPYLLEQLANDIKNFKIHIIDTNPFSQSQVTAGGVDTKEIDADSLMSRRVKGLYIVGELLDVDGICGGYNLQWAWASGIIAGRHAGRNCHD